MASARLSSYLDYLPAIFRQDDFAGRFLLAFERVLSGLHPPDPDDPLPQQPGLETLVEGLHRYFDPAPTAPEQGRTPAEFLPWLAGWVGLSLRQDWSEDEKRRFLSQIVTLYRWRGTKRGLQRMLETYTQEPVEIYEFETPAHYFQVEITLSERDPRLLRRKEKIARAIVDQEKPAHTFYALTVLTPAMQIRNDPDIGLRLGINTLLGTINTNR
jgi:phage tail-like protein